MKRASIMVIALCSCAVTASGCGGAGAGAGAGKGKGTRTGLASGEQDKPTSGSYSLLEIGHDDDDLQGYEETFVPEADMRAGCAEGALLDCALLAAAGMEADEDNSAAMTVIVEAYVKKGQIEKALAVAHGIRDFEAQAKTLAALGGAFMKGGQKERALKILARALKAAKSIEYSLLTDCERAEALAAVAGTYAELGECANALGVTAIIASDFEKVDSLDSAMRGCTENGKKDPGPEALLSALKIVGTIEWDHFKAVALVKAAGVLTDEARFEMIFEAAKTIKEDRSKCLALAGAAASMARAGLPGKAEAVLKSALEIAGGMKGDESDQAEALKAVAVGFAEAGQCDKALGVAGGIKSEYSRADALAEVSGGCARGGQYGRALEAAGKIADDQQKARALTEIASACAESLQGENASKLLSKVVEAVKKIGSGAADEKFKALAAISALYMELGRTDEATGALSMILEGSKGAASQTYVADETRDQTVGLLLKAGKYDWALELAGAIEDRDKVDVLVRIAGSLVEAGQQEKAVKVLLSAADAMSLVDYAPDRPPALAAIAASYAKAGKKEKALELLCSAMEESKQLHSEYDAPEALAAVAAGYAEVGTYDKALEAAAMIMSKRVQCGALAAMGSIQAAAGVKLDEKAMAVLKTIFK